MALTISHLDKYIHYNKAQLPRIYLLSAGSQQLILLHYTYFFQGGKFNHLICYFPFTTR